MLPDIYIGWVYRHSLHSKKPVPEETGNRKSGTNFCWKPSRRRDPRAPSTEFNLLYRHAVTFQPEDHSGAMCVVIHKTNLGAKGFYFSKINGLQNILALAGFWGSFKYL